MRLIEPSVLIIVTNTLLFYTRDHMSCISAKLHYTDTGYGHVAQHHQRTSSQQFYKKFATSQCQSPTSRHVTMLGYGKFLSVGGESVVQQVVELLWARPRVVLYNMSVAGVRVVEFGTNDNDDDQPDEWWTLIVTSLAMSVDEAAAAVVAHDHSRWRHQY